MKKAGFTLAEVLITLMILGIIAALTVPSLIQNTQKKEQIVQLKKALSTMNQAVTMDYALKQEDLTTRNPADIFTERLSGTSKNGGIRTQDGITYYVSDKSDGKNCSSMMDPINDSNYCYAIIVSTLPEPEKPDPISSSNVNLPEHVSATNTAKGAALTGYYLFYAGGDRIVPSDMTAQILYAKDATTVSGTYTGT